MKKILTTLLALFCITSYAQIDTIIKTKAYISYYSYKLKEPLIVTYKLYKGGGDCNRDKFYFKPIPKTATDKDYNKCGYDKGHLANAEDFAYNCELDELTFRYYNCVPQTPELNRGIWKAYENKVRDLSKTDSIIVICGSFFGNRVIGNGVALPDTCWKVVYNMNTKIFLKCHIFKNNKAPTEKLMDFVKFNELFKAKYGYDIKILIQNQYNQTF